MGQPWAELGTYWENLKATGVCMDAIAESSRIEKIEPRYIMVHADQQHANDDTIDLFALLYSLYEQRYLIVTITLLCTLIAALVAFSIPPKYKVTTQLVPSKIYQYSPLMMKSDSDFSAATLFSQFIDKLQSNANVIAFLSQNSVWEKINVTHKKLNAAEKMQRIQSVAQNYKVVVDIKIT